MPVSYHVDFIRRRIYSAAVGMITLNDIRKHLHDKSALQNSQFSELFDCGEAKLELSVADVNDLATEFRLLAEHQAGPVAVVAKSPVIFGLCRVYEMQTEDLRPIQIFRDKNEAESWLDSLSVEKASPDQ